MDHATEQLFALLLIAGIVYLATHRHLWRRSGTSHGTARWATEQDCRAAGMLDGGDELILEKTRGRRLLRMRPVHAAIFSPAGGGKTISFSTVWLLTKRGSMVVNDVKNGELYRLTAAARRVMGLKVVRLDPFGVCGPGGDTLNPVDLIGDGPECVDDCRAMMEAMCPEAPEGDKDPHWREQCINVGTGLLSWICTDLRAEERSLVSLRELVSKSELCEAAVETMRARGDVFARMAGVIAQLEDKEKASVFSTVHRHTAFLDSPAIIENICQSSFNPRELLKGDGMTIYLILPAHLLAAETRWLRLVIASLIRLIAREAEQENR